MCAVNSTSRISGKNCSICSIISSPSSVGINFFSSIATYPRFWIVSNVGAYVLGRPIPSSSSVLTRRASVYRGGGWVKCCLGSMSCFTKSSPAFSGGKNFSSSVVPSSLPSTYTFMNPGKETLEPTALKIAVPAVISTESVSSRAEDI
ncbi:hypothetical protein D3C81_1729250 [compost metagenome]